MSSTAAAARTATRPGGRHLLPAVLGVVALVLAGLATAPAQARDPRPALYNPWPMCGDAPDDDGLYCLASVTRNGTTLPSEPTTYPHEWPWVDLLDDGTVRFGLSHYTTPGNDDGNANPANDWTIKVNTGSIHPREVYGHVQDVAYSSGQYASGAYWFKLAFSPVPVAWVGYAPGHDPSECMVGACGDDTTRADLEYDGFVTGYVTDLMSSGLSPAERDLREGYVEAYGAQDAGSYYDVGTNALVVQLANPHLHSDGTVVHSSYESFIPYAMLTGLMEVPDPASLTGGEVVVTRSAGGSTTTAPFTLTHEATGIRIDIPDVTFSSPTYRIRPKKSAPGQPRIVDVERVAPHQVKVSFRAPLANGGADVDRYRARCRPSAGGAWQSASRDRSPITVGGLPRRPTTCQVKAHNRIGWGRWSRSANL